MSDDQSENTPSEVTAEDLLPEQPEQPDPIAGLRERLEALEKENVQNKILSERLAAERDMLMSEVQKKKRSRGYYDDDDEEEERPAKKEKPAQPSLGEDDINKILQKAKFKDFLSENADKIKALEKIDPAFSESIKITASVDPFAAMQLTMNKLKTVDQAYLRKNPPKPPAPVIAPSSVETQRSINQYGHEPIDGHLSDEEVQRRIYDALSRM